MSNYKRTIITLKPENEQTVNGNKKPIGTLLIEEKGGAIDNNTSGKITVTLQNLKPNSMYYLHLIAPLKGVCKGVKICNIFSDHKGQASVKVDINIYDLCNFGIPLSSFTVIAVFESTMETTALTGYTGDVVLWKGTFVDLSKPNNEKNNEFHKDEHHKDEYHKDEYHKDEHHKDEHHKDEHHKDEHHKDEHHKDEHHKDEHHKDEHHKDEHHKDEHHKDEHHKDEHHKDEHHKDEHHNNQHNKGNSVHKTNGSSLPNPTHASKHHEELNKDVSHNEKEIEFQIPELNKTTPIFNNAKSENKYHKNFNNSLKAYRRERNKNFNFQNNRNKNNLHFDQLDQTEFLKENGDFGCFNNDNALDEHNNNNNDCHNNDNHNNDNHVNDNHNNDNHDNDNHNNDNHNNDNHNNDNHNNDNHNNDSHNNDNHNNDNHNNDNHNNDNHNNDNHDNDNHNNDSHNNDNHDNDNQNHDNHNNDNHNNDNHNNDNHNNDNHNNDNHNNDNHNNDNHNNDNHNNSTVHSTANNKNAKKYQELSEIITNSEPVNPFKNQTKNVRWVRFSDEKFDILPENMNYLKDSHFVELNLFANHHFLVGKSFDSNGPRFIFAMPAYYERSTRITANNLGFVQFKCCDNIRAVDGIAGYWLMPII